MSRTRILPLITLVTAIGTLPARAADEGKAWTLHDCMAYAVEHSPRSKIQELTNANTDRDHLAAIMNFLPYISGSVGANANFGRSLDPETNTYTAQNNFNNSYSVSGSLPLFNGFKVVNNLRIAKIARLQGAENMQLINDEIALETMQAYADVHYYRGMVNLAGEQLAESKNTLYQAKVQEELGLKGNADVLEIEAKVASEDFNPVSYTHLDVYKRQPYTEWEWNDLGIRLGGPNLCTLPDGSILIGSREVQKEPHCGLYGLDGSKRAELLLRLPSGGDCSYPGFVVRGNTLWIS